MIFKGLRHLQELEKLDLSFCQIDENGGAMIGRYLTFIRELKSLAIRETNVVNAELCTGLKYLEKTPASESGSTRIERRCCSSSVLISFSHARTERACFRWC